MLSTVPSMHQSNENHGEHSSGKQGYVHSIETAGAVDGPGLRFVVFTTGCPLNCAYCHNPDSQKLKGGKLTTVDELLSDIALYKNYLTNTGGGVTLSGGEPLVQPEFTRAIFEGCKAMGLHTALDTSGFLGKSASDELLAVTDLVLLDIKSGLSDTYKKVTGVDLQPTLDFAKRLDAIGKKMWIRYVLVPGLTDAEDNVRTVAEFVATLNNVERVEVLPFHQMGVHKWEALGRPYTLKDTPSPTAEQTESAREIFRKAGVSNVL